MGVPGQAVAFRRLPSLGASFSAVALAAVPLVDVADDVALVADVVVELFVRPLINASAETPPPP